MDADFSIELGQEDPVLDFPWKDPAGKLAYVDLKRRPELMASIEEAEQFPELREFLRTLNSARSMVETAKCDAWTTSELSPEEEIYDASHKFASYVDVVFSNIDARLSFQSAATNSLPESWLHCCGGRRKLRRRRKCACGGVTSRRRRGVREGFYFTLYVSGYGNDEAGAHQNWGVGLKLVGNAILQLSASGVR